ncbi:MAG TPA: FxsA family protein, partial [Spirochaetia bacterium]|nr:FxsA family protein [Spirochaetia bacterium]
LFDRGFLLRSLLTLLLISLLPIADIALLFYLSTLLGAFLTIAIVLGAGLFGVFITYREMRRTLVPIRRKVNEGYYPETEFANLAGTIICSILLATPGLIGDLIGLILFVPVLRRKAGRALTRRLEGRMKEIYEYLKLYD